MDQNEFDAIARRFGEASSRRRAIKALAGGAGLAVLAGLGVAKAKASAPNRFARPGLPGDDPTGEPPADDDSARIRPQNQFVGDCRASGGTPSRVRTYVVKCCHADAGWCTECDFNYDPPSCREIYYHTGAEHEVERPGGGVLVDQP